MLEPFTAVATAACIARVLGVACQFVVGGLTGSADGEWVEAAGEAAGSDAVKGYVGGCLQRLRRRPPGSGETLLKGVRKAHLLALKQVGKCHRDTLDALRRSHEFGGTSYVKTTTSQSTSMTSSTAG